MHRNSSLALALALLAGCCLASPGDASVSEFKVLYKFCSEGKFFCTDGKNPTASLIMDLAGNLYGTTSAGGATGNGVIFELAKSGGRYKYQVLHNFDGNAEGGVPVTSLIMDGAGTRSAGAPAALTASARQRR